VIVLGVTFLILSLISAVSLNTAKRFEREGRAATAIVTERYKTEGRDSDGNRTTTYWLMLEYVAQGGGEITITETANSSEYRRAALDAPFELLYLESEPRTVELTAGSNRQGSKIVQVIALIIGALWLVGFWIIGGWAVSAVRARRFGLREEVAITEVRRTNFKVNNKPRYKLIWTDGQGREGKSLMRKWSDVESFRPGDHIEIYQGVKVSWWVGDIGERPEFSR